MLQLPSVHLTGISSTGKTTLAPMICEANKDYKLVKSAVRDSITEAGGLRSQGKSTTQLKAFLNMAFRLEEARRNGYPYVSERDLICFMAYSRALGFNTSYEEAFIREVAKSSNVILVVMRPTIKFVADEYRPVDVEFQKSWSNHIEELADELKHKYRAVYYMEEVELDARVAKIQELLQEHG